MSSWHQFRTVQEFKHDGMHLSTSSDHAAKYIDALLDQLLGWSENEELGGVEGTFEKLYAADPKCVMGRVLECGMQLYGTGTSIYRNPELNKAVNQLVEECNSESSTMTSWERLHVRALQLFSIGCLEAACEVWERLLIDSPLDIFALRFAQDTYFYTSRAVQLRDSVARVFPHWNRHMPLYRHLFGLLSFGLVETHRYAEAEKCAMEGLSYAPGDGWSTHSVAHVKEMMVKPTEGAEFLAERQHLWSVASSLDVHLNWHYCLFKLESADYESVIRTYDEYMCPRITSPKCSILDIVDGTALMFRLELEGQNVGSRWLPLADVCAKHTRDHITLFNDVHYLMAFLGASRAAERDELVSTFREFRGESANVPKTHGLEEFWNRELLCSVSSSLVNTNRVLGQQIGDNLLDGMSFYANGDYDAAFEQLYPIRYEIDSSTLGGSHAQRDLFKQLLIHTCLKSNKYRCSYARSLLYERLALRPDSSLSQRLLAHLESMS